MKTRKKKIFDAVKMVREIRDAMYEQREHTHVNTKKFSAIKTKWTHLLEQQQSANAVKEPVEEFTIKSKPLTKEELKKKKAVLYKKVSKKKLL